MPAHGGGHGRAAAHRATFHHTPIHTFHTASHHTSYSSSPYRSHARVGAHSLPLPPRLLTPEQAAHAFAETTLSSLYLPGACPSTLAVLGIFFSAAAIPLLAASLGSWWQSATCTVRPTSGEDNAAFVFSLTTARRCLTWYSSEPSICANADASYSGVSSPSLTSLGLDSSTGAGATALLSLALLCALPFCLPCSACCRPSLSAPDTPASRARLHGSRLFRYACGALASATAVALYAGGLPGSTVDASLLSTGACLKLQQRTSSSGAPGFACAIVAAVLLCAAAVGQGVFFSALRGKAALVTAAGGEPVPPPPMPPAPTPLQLMALVEGQGLVVARQLGSWGEDGGLTGCPSAGELELAGVPEKGPPAAGVDVYAAALRVFSAAPLEAPLAPLGVTMVQVRFLLIFAFLLSFLFTY